MKIYNINFKPFVLLQKADCLWMWERKVSLRRAAIKQETTWKSIMIIIILWWAQKKSISETSSLEVRARRAPRLLVLYNTHLKMKLARSRHVGALRHVSYTLCNVLSSVTLKCHSLAIEMSLSTPVEIVESDPREGRQIFFFVYWVLGVEIDILDIFDK